MITIAIIGVTGFAGSHIARAATARGHRVEGVSRNLPADPIEGASYNAAPVSDDAVLKRVVADADVVVASLSPRGDLAGKLTEAVARIATEAAAAGTRLIVVGGAGALRVAPDGPRVADGDSLPAFLIEESRQTAAVVAWLEQSAPDGLNWTYISPAFGFSPRDPGEATGSYTFAGNQATFDSKISAPDFAAAVTDEIEADTRSGHISVYSEITA
ncbi:NAD(P)-dependent oxidoreductase [Paractinoplanes atraurantiacus]|uniref:NAD(P)-binding domain-containing protein n=1 Tax=Paractinoplanes atraurantiacus TaxID=1036182 RepID=A0A285H6L3_9ACTN|nr:NAD(P)H-binding protein [Actinoplanes atraurantiacus]SNY31399.1 hypothetical protein SAMN05421748_103551 [Actinoplanes atraurantiacus]